MITYTYFFIAYAFTILAIVLFFIYRPCGFWAVIVGLLLSPLYMYIHETWIDPSGWWTYLATVVIALFYTLPVVFLTTVAYIVIRLVKKEGPKTDTRVLYKTSPENFIKRVYSYSYLLLPSIMISMFIPFSRQNWQIYLTGREFMVYLIFVYAITLTGIILYLVFRPCRFILLPLGLLISPLFLFIYDTWINPSFVIIPYAPGMFGLIYYALPCTLISVVSVSAIAVMKKIKSDQAE